LVNDRRFVTGIHVSELIVIRIVAPAGGGASAYTYGASEALVDIPGLRLSQIDRLGFDSTGYQGPARRGSRWARRGRSAREGVPLP